MVEGVKHILGRFTYVAPDVSNLILVLVGVIMSYPNLATAVEARPRWKYALAVGCLVLGLGGVVTTIYQKHQFDSKLEKLVDDDSALIKSTSHLVDLTNVMATDFGVVMPQITTLQATVAGFDAKIAAAKGNPRLIAQYQSEAAKARTELASVSQSLVSSLASSVISEMESWVTRWRTDWSSADWRISYSRNQAEVPGLIAERDHVNISYSQQVLPTLKSANALRELLLRNAPPDPDDEVYSKEFAKMIAGAPMDSSEMWNLTLYMQKLVKRFAPQALQNVRVTLD
jgi:hypothetical protein